MPAVSTTISESINGSQIADDLEGDGFGVSLGPVATSSFAPVVNRPLNQGHQDLYIYHDGASAITEVAFHIQQYGTGTGYSYGGADTAAADIASLITLGNASGSSKNNDDQNSGGIWMDMDWDSTDSSRFDQANFPSRVKIFGDNNSDGISLTSAFALASEALVYQSGGSELGASAPVAGSIGPSGSTTLGDNGHIKLRIYLPSSYGASGFTQTDFVTSYVYDN